MITSETPIYRIRRFFWTIFKDRMDKGFLIRTAGYVQISRWWILGAEARLEGQPLCTWDTGNDGWAGRAGGYAA